jgi:fido (protein-threonine AMPylation protein)
MPDYTLDEIIEMNIAYPFMEGTRRATRSWFDLLLYIGFRNAPIGLKLKRSNI